MEQDLKDIFGLGSGSWKQIWVQLGFLLVWLTPFSRKSYKQSYLQVFQGELHCKFEQCFVQSTVKWLFGAKNIGRSWTYQPQKPFYELFYFDVQKMVSFHFYVVVHFRTNVPYFKPKPVYKYPKFEAFLKSPSVTCTNYYECNTL